MRAPFLVVAAATVLATRSASAADPPCSTLPNPVYIETGDTQVPMLEVVGRALRDSDEPMSLVFVPVSTCVLAEHVYRGTPTTVNMRYIPSTAEEAAWTPGTVRNCTNDVTGGIPIDLGIGATFISSCSKTITDLKPSNISIFRGPVQAYGFVTPEGVGSTVPAITREEAYFAFGGFGATGGQEPWTGDPMTTLLIRPATASTLLTLAANVAPDLLPAGRWKGDPLARSTNVIEKLVAAASTPSAKQTIGIMGTEVFDANRDKMDLLAYQAAGQRYAYYPDSSPTARDKVNVRDGHYVPWSFTEYLAEVGTDGAVVKPRVKRLMELIFGDVATRLKVGSSDIDPLSLVIARGLIPDCAMKVTRAFDGGDLSLHAPTTPCGCAYEAFVDPSLATSPPMEWAAACPACTTDATCGAGKCRRGYCEAR